MAHKLTFTNPDVFRIAYEGFLMTAKGTTRQEHRLIDRILTGFERVSMAEADLVIPGFPPHDPASPRIRYLDTTGDGVVILEDTEYDFLKKVLDGLTGPAMLSRLIGRLQDFVDTAEKGDAKTLAGR